MTDAAKSPSATKCLPSPHSGAGPSHSQVQSPPGPVHPCCRGPWPSASLLGTSCFGEGTPACASVLCLVPWAAGSLICFRSTVMDRVKIHPAIIFKDMYYLFDGAHTSILCQFVSQVQMRICNKAYWARKFHGTIHNCGVSNLHNSESANETDLHYGLESGDTSLLKMGPFLSYRSTKMVCGQ